MIPLEVQVKNFLSYDDNGGDGYLFDFRDHRLWSISGDNGAGKSAIFDAITYALFGRHRGGASNDVELLRKGCNEMFCSFTFSYSEKTYRATRTLKRRTGRSGKVTHDRACQLDWFDPVADAWREVPGTSTVSGLEDHVCGSLLGFGYDTFVSSILLRQGDSDKLIREGPKNRFTYLSGILDLRQFKRLEELAAGQAKALESQYKSLREHLGEVGIPSEAEVKDATEKATTAANKAQVAEANHTNANDRLRRVSEFHKRAKKHQEIKVKVTRFAAVESRATVIRSNAKEKRTIDDVLPKLRAAKQALDDADAAEALARSAHKELASLDVDGLSTKLNNVKKERKTSKGVLLRHQRNLRDLRTKRKDLERDLRLASRLDELAENVHAAKATIAELTPEVKKLPKLKKRRDRLEAISRAQPSLEQYVDARLEEVELIASFPGDPDSAVSGAKKEAEELQEEIHVLGKFVQDLANRLSKEEAELALAGSTLEERQKAGSEGVCSHCGQKVSQDHIRKEIQSCKAEVTRLKKTVGETRRRSNTSAGKLRSLEKKLEKANERHRDLVASSKDLGKTRIRLAKLLESSAIKTLPKDLQAIPRRSTEELEQALQSVLQEIDDFPEVRTAVSGLEKSASDLQSQQTLCAKWQAERDKIHETLTATRARQVRQAAERLDAQILTTETEEEEAKGILERLDHEVESHGANLQETRDRVAELTRTIEVQTAAAKGKRETAAGTLQGVEDVYLPVSQRKISFLERRQSTLSRAEAELDLLEEAERQLGPLRGRVNELEEELEGFPPEHRISIEEAEDQVKQAFELLTEAQAAAQGARDEALLLAQQRNERLEMQLAASTAEVESKIWRRVAKLLGRNGIQLALMKQDLAEIETLANVMLAKVSAGSLQLTIECKQGRTGEEIFFRCVDSSSADEPLDVAFLSGGQKFRVAVALAAGIGQRAGLGGTMPSQIVDEGFGSLDETGRKEMLETIRDMSDHFERIIVVSHTDSFHDPALFPSRYELRKDARKTIVTASV